MKTSAALVKTSAALVKTSMNQPRTAFASHKPSATDSRCRVVVAEKSSVPASRMNLLRAYDRFIGRKRRSTAYQQLQQWLRPAQDPLARFGEITEAKPRAVIIAKLTRLRSDIRRTLAAAVAVLWALTLLGMAGKVDLPAFKKELQTHIQNQRKEWPEKQCAGLADYMGAELQRQLGERFTTALCSNLVGHIAFDLANFTAALEQEELVRQHYRWAIHCLATRKPTTPDEINAFQNVVKDCFENYSQTLKAEYSPSLHPELVRAQEHNFQLALGAIRDEFFPGMKAPFSAEQARILHKNALDNWKELKQAITQVNCLAENHSDNAYNRTLIIIGGQTLINTNSTPNPGAAENSPDLLNKAGIQAAFAELLGEMLYLGVEHDEEYSRAQARFANTALEQYEAERAKRKAAVKEEEQKHLRRLLNPYDD